MRIRRKAIAFAAQNGDGMEPLHLGQHFGIGLGFVTTRLRQRPRVSLRTLADARCAQVLPWLYRYSEALLRVPLGFFLTVVEALNSLLPCAFVSGLSASGGNEIEAHIVSQLKR